MRTAHAGGHARIFAFLIFGLSGGADAGQEGRT